jgi:hypothetical protein
MLETFDSLVHPWFDLMKHNAQEFRALAPPLRDTLLPKLLSGEVRVAAKMSSASAGEGVADPRDDLRPCTADAG